MIKAGGFEIRWYGVMIAMAFLAGLWLARREARRKEMDPSLVDEFSYIVFPAALLGARIYYVLFSDAQFFLRHPLKIAALWEGGLAIHGAILSGTAAALWFTRRRKIPFLRWADTLAPSIILGQAIGRFGCFMNGDAFGVPTRMPWGVVYSPDSPAGARFPGIPLHPTQLYELVLDAMIFLILWRTRKKTLPTGLLFFFYAMLYSLARIGVEFFRADSLYIVEHLRAAHGLGVIIIVLSALSIFIIHRRGISLEPRIPGGNPVILYRRKPQAHKKRGVKKLPGI